MSSLRQLLAEHGTVLVLDAASSRIQVGRLAVGSADWITSDAEAGIGVFQSVEQLGVRLDDVGAFLFCDGPGSILGIRTVAMALRTWGVLKPRPVFAYCSLALIAEDLGRNDVAVIADARRETWHCLRRGEPLRRVPSAALTGELVMPEHFRHWSPVPVGTRQVPYSIRDLWARVADADLCLRTESPDAFLHEEPQYVTWTPQIHRAPSPS